MSFPAEAVHPAAVSYVPKRAKRTVTAMGRMSTPVMLPRADRSQFDRPGTIAADMAGRAPFEPWVRDGAVWQPLRHRTGNPYDPGPHVSVPGFLSWLAGTSRPGDTLTTGLDEALAGTPLCRRVETVPYANHALEERRGWQPFREEQARRILRDGRAAASAALAAFVRDEIALVEDTVLLRSPPRIRLGRGGKGAWEIDPTRGDRRRPGFALARPEDAEAFHGRRVDEHAGIREARALLGGIDPGDDDLRLACNLLPKSFHDVVEPVAHGRRTASDEVRAACRTHLEGIGRLMELGECGRIAEADVGPACLAMLAAAGAAEGAAYGLPSHLREPLAEARRYVGLVVLPRLSPPDLGDDVADLAVLAP